MAAVGEKWVGSSRRSNDPGVYRWHVRFIVKNRYRRTGEDVAKVIALSKLEENELNEITQVLQFSPNSDETSHIKFLELDSHLSETLKEGDWYVYNDTIIVVVFSFPQFHL